MKRMHYLLAGLIIPAMLTSCSSEDGVVETPIAPSDKDLPVVKLYANGGGSDTRTTIDNTGMVSWSGTDKINVNGRTSTSITLTGAHTAIFEVAAVAPYAAIYPSTAAKSFNADGTVSLDIPSEQKYKDGDSFADDVNISVAYSETEQLSFKNVCGLLKATIKADDGVTLSKIKKVRFNAGMPISGQAKLNPKTMEIAFSGTTKKYIDVVFDTPKTITGAEEIKVIWSLPPRVYDNWTIELVDETDNILKTISTNAAEAVSPVSVRRSIISTVKDTQVYPQYYTVGIKSDYAKTDKPGNQWMYKGETRTITVTEVTPGYSFRKWIPNSSTTSTVDNNRITITAYTNEVISMEVLEGLIIERYKKDDTGGARPIPSGEYFLWSRTPLKADGEFLPNYVESAEWTPLPVVSTITKCPDGWKFPIHMEQYSAARHLVKVGNYYAKDGLITFNWYPVKAVGEEWQLRCYNLSPEARSIVGHPSDDLIPREAETQPRGYYPETTGQRIPIRCVKDLI